MIILKRILGPEDVGMLKFAFIVLSGKVKGRRRVLKSDQENASMPTPNIGFSKAMSGFIMMMTQQGKLLYISENAAEYLGHSMEDLLIHGDSVYDVVDKQDHIVVQNQLACRSNSSTNNNNNGSNNGGGIGHGHITADEKRLFLCRINVSRNSRRQLRFGDQKVVLVEGHYLPFVPLCNRNESVFLASCTPVVLPETRESVVQGATNIFTTIHSMDMKYLHIDKTAESHMEYSRSELIGISWYNLLHWDSIRTAYCKHQTVIQSDQERSSTALLRLQSRSGRWFWIHCVLQVKDTSEECQHPIIVCTNQVLSEREAEILRASSWLYQYSSQSKFTYGVCPSLPNSAAPQSAQHEAMLQGYVPPDAEYSNGRLSAASLPYGMPAPPSAPSGHHELDFGSVSNNTTPTAVPYLQPSHPLEEGQLEPWNSAKDRMLVKQEPTEVYGCGDSSAVSAQRSTSSGIRASSVQQQQSTHQVHQETVDAVVEPVDMSINNSAPPTEHDANNERHSTQHQQHCPNHTGASASEFCHCSEAQLPAVSCKFIKSFLRLLCIS
ncbi:hypothetical protein QAD02_004658 [Eretmocerus hayati]|uniref:Uncharacterized protein n=1 Tax=Eretmocerus hayati TaxID=131215 RepID=A0ACC2NR92_9HYME|nr:hypothetical protein QAD02_004658 [Eretmocerus hayati]